MTLAQAFDFVKKHGIVLASAKGSVPNLADAIAGERIKGSWWGHAKGHQIFSIFEAIEDSDEILVCRLVNGKRTFIHRRLWPALVRSASQFSPNQIAKVKDEHTSSGRHISIEVPFPKWVPKDVLKEAEKLEEKEALSYFHSVTQNKTRKK